MVKLNEIQNMFWGVTLDGGKRYTQTVERSFHISMAALESSAEPAKPSEKHVSVMIQHEKAEFVMCTLEYGRLFQQPLDLNFTEGEEVTFFLNGTGIVHLTGYLMEEGQYDDEMQLSDMSDEDSDEEAPQLLEMDSMDDEDDSDDEDYGKDTSKKKGVKKRKGKEVVPVKSKKAKVVMKAEESDDDDDDEDDSDDDSDGEEFDMQMLLEGEDLDDDDDDDSDVEEEGEEETDEEDEEDDEEDEDQEVPVKSQKTKRQETKPKQEGKTPVKKENKTATPDSASQNKTTGQNGIDSTPGSEEKKKKKKKKKKKNKNTEGQETQNSTEQSAPSHPGKETPKKRVYAGGVIVEDLKLGHGPEAKSGRQMHMYYVGTLAQDGKQFDSVKSGKPFKFRLGKGEVIRGWDIGVNGMKVGGKRKITIPPAMGYGKVRQELIPPNSTLIFEVELKSVS